MVLGPGLLAAWMSGGAGQVVVAGSTPWGSRPARGAPLTNTPQPQLAAPPTSASFPAVAMGSSNSQTITLQNGGSARLTISSVNVTGAGFGTSVLGLPMTVPAGPTAPLSSTFSPTSLRRLLCPLLPPPPPPH